MLKQMLLSTVLVAAAGNVATCSAEEFGGVEEAKAMLNRAVFAVKSDKLAAIAKFNYNDPQFRDRDLFVFCFNGEDGKFTAHEAMVTWDVRTLRDRSGKSYGEDMYKRAKVDQIAEVAYVSPFPGTTWQVPKRA